MNKLCGFDALFMFVYMCCVFYFGVPETRLDMPLVPRRTMVTDPIYSIPILLAGGTCFAAFSAYMFLCTFNS